MEAEEPHYLLSATWRTRKAGGGQIWKPKNLEVNDVSPSQSPKAQEPGAPVSKGRRWMPSAERELILPSPPLLLFRPQQTG